MLFYCLSTFSNVVRHLKGIPHSIHNVCNLFRVTEQINLFCTVLPGIEHPAILAEADGEDNRVAVELLFALRGLDKKLAVLILDRKSVV